MGRLLDEDDVIDAVQQHREGVLGGYEYDEGVAFVYAAAHNHIIEVVKQMPPAQPDARYINANELIKRLQQAGLDDAVSIAVKMAGHERLKHVPSAQPSLVKESGDLVNGLVKDDTISRKQAIDALCRRCDLAAEDDEPCTEKCNDIKILEKLSSPSVEIFEIGKTYPLDGYEIEIKKSECGNSFVTIKRPTKNVWRKNE